jgi:hypothetical protein
MGCSVVGDVCITHYRPNLSLTAARKAGRSAEIARKGKYIKYKYKNTSTRPPLLPTDSSYYHLLLSLTSYQHLVLSLPVASTATRPAKSMIWFIVHGAYLNFKLLTLSSKLLPTNTNTEIIK